VNPKNITQTSLFEQIKRVAIESVQAAGRIAKKKFREGFQVHVKDEHGDLLTEADLLAEKEILTRIHAHFPEHAVRSEEAGFEDRPSDWLWMVDPLDGTNNFAMGLPVYGVCITVLYQGKPCLGVIYDSELEQSYVAVLGQGATRDGQPLQMSPGSKRMTIGWIQGHQVQNDPRALRLKAGLDSGGLKRVLRLWAPSLLWAMAARGDLDGIVLYNSEGDDLYAGVLLVQEAGGIVTDFEGRPFEQIQQEPYLIACHPNRKDELLALVRAYLST
jgi:myo-inositol-1(or 4)-monophosphatase